MWQRHRTLAAETRALLTKLKSHGWKNDAGRDDLVRQLSAVKDLEPEDVAWMATETDPALRQAGLALLKRFPYDRAAESLFPLLATRSEALLRAALNALEGLAGATFPEKMLGYLEHRDPAVVNAALEYARRNPSDRYLPGVAKALESTSLPIRRKAFGIVEANASPRAAALAAKALDDDDEEIRLRAVVVLAKTPDEAHIAPLLKRCRHDSARVQEAALTALTPLLARADERFNHEILPLLSDNNPKVRELAIRILQRQAPAKVAEAFLQAFRGSFGIVRERGIEALSAFGPEYIRAFLAEDAHPDPGIAALASAIAVTIKSPEVVPHCLRYLDGDDFWMRDRAAQALAQIRDARTLPRLFQLLEDPESNLSAANALGVWGAPEALPSLLAAYKKGATDLRLEILDAFAKIPDPRVAALLDSIVKADPEPIVRSKAGRLAAERTGAAPPSGLPPGAGVREFAPVDFTAVPRPSLQDLLRHARAIDASDLHLASGTVPHVRVHGQLTPLPLPEATPAQMEAWIAPALSEDRRARLESERQLDFCHKDPELGRFRTNVFFQRKGANAVFRLVPLEVPTVEDIGLPEALWDLANYAQGLVLVTGPSGCGKTTTLAALIDRVNQTQRSHILTIEDPIEYVHRGKEALVNQREVPSHTRSFARALRQALREDPDVILVGEMRDLETISLAITASETGHLVLATLHTTTAASTVDRVINSFPPDQQGQIRMMIADSLKAVVSQILLPRRDGSGRVAAFEILRNTPNVAGLVREGKTFQIPTAIQTGASLGMITMDGALQQLVQKGAIDAKTAFDHAQRKEAFEAAVDEAGNAA
jgi:twitching motility protein PilT